MVTVQVGDVPVTPPDQLAKVELASGVAVRVTTVPAVKDVPDGLVVTVPVPAPVFVIVRVYVVGGGGGVVLKLASMVWLAVTLLKV
jgi:hypothetical protein